MDKISGTKWEECRGLGRSFGYNRAEGEAETIAPDELIYLLVDIVSKNGNLLLDVGPEADGTIPPVQMTRLQALGAWLDLNGDAIYGTHHWKPAVGQTSEGIQVRFTQKDSTVYATLLGQPGSIARSGCAGLSARKPGAVGGTIRARHQNSFAGRSPRTVCPSASHDRAYIVTHHWLGPTSL